MKRSPVPSSHHHPSLLHSCQSHGLPCPEPSPLGDFGREKGSAGRALQGHRGAESARSGSRECSAPPCPLPLSAALQQQQELHPRDPGAASCSHRAALDLQSFSVPGINYRLCRSCLQPPLYNLSSCFASPLQEPLVNPKSSTGDCPGGPSSRQSCPARGQGCGTAGTTSTWQGTKTAKPGVSRGK